MNTIDIYQAIPSSMRGEDLALGLILLVTLAGAGFAFGLLFDFVGGWLFEVLS